MKDKTEYYRMRNLTKKALHDYERYLAHFGNSHRLVQEKRWAWIDLSNRTHEVWTKVMAS